MKYGLEVTGAKVSLGQKRRRAGEGTEEVPLTQADCEKITATDFYDLNTTNTRSHTVDPTCPTKARRLPQNTVPMFLLSLQ